MMIIAFRPLRFVTAPLGPRILRITHQSRPAVNLHEHLISRTLAAAGSPTKVGTNRFMLSESIKNNGSWIEYPRTMSVRKEPTRPIAGRTHSRYQ
jgi:hypothetical protein